MKKYKVIINLEEGIGVEVDAESINDAENKARNVAAFYGGTSYPLLVMLEKKLNE